MTLFQSLGRAASIAIGTLLTFTSSATGDCTGQWNAFTSGVNNTVRALEVFDDGDGEALYVGGEFIFAGGASATYIAKWDGEAWSTVGDGLNGMVLSMKAYDDGNGPALFVGGTFTHAGSTQVNRIAKWDGKQWHSLGTGITFNGGEVTSFAVFDDGTGEALYVGGFFATISGVNASRVAKWDGTTFSPLGAGTNGHVLELHAADLGDGPILYLGGVSLTSAGGVSVQNAAQWDGNSWSSVGAGFNNAVRAIYSWDDGTGPSVYFGGNFTSTGGSPMPYAARWDGKQFNHVANFTSACLAFRSFDDGTGETLYVGGIFPSAGSPNTSNIARWTGTNFAPVGAGVNSGVATLVPFNGALVAGGNFTTAGGNPANRVASWQGTAPIAITEHPQDVQLDEGEKAVFTAAVEQEEGVSYQWRRDGQDIDPEQNIHVTGIHTPTLHIEGATSDDEGAYDVVVSNSCSQVVSEAANLIVMTGTPGDLNNDGVVDVSDLLLLLSAWGTCPAQGACPADLNGDGSVDVSDLLVLLSSWG